MRLISYPIEERYLRNLACSDPLIQCKNHVLAGIIVEFVISQRGDMIYAGDNRFHVFPRCPPTTFAPDVGVP